jgi:hypothetical protein
MQSCYIYMCDAALEKCRRGGYRIDLIIAQAKSAAPKNPPKTWSAQFVEPDKRIAF